MLEAALKGRLQVLAGRTRLQVLQQRAPLKIARAFPQPDKSLNLMVMDASPGLLGGDDYRFDWHFAPNSHATISTQGFARVHPSRGQVSRQTTTLKLDDNAVCKYLPLPTILFRDADFRARTDIELAPNARLFWAETLCVGRIARGEAWQFQRAVSQVNIVRGDEMVWTNRSRIEPQKRTASTRGAWENFMHHSLFCAFSPTLDALDSLDNAREIIAQHGFHGGASAINGGIIGSLFGTRSEAMHECLQVLADALTPSNAAI